MALLELHIDVGEGLVGPLPHSDQAVVDADRPDNDQGNDTEHNPTGGGHETAPDWGSGESFERRHLISSRPVAANGTRVRVGISVVCRPLKVHCRMPPRTKKDPER